LSGSSGASVVIGVDAGASLTTGQRNPFIGNLAGNAETS
jgi:hypothetical protein